MGIRLICLLFLLMEVGNVNSQVIITSRLGSDGIMLKDQLWNVIISNNSNQIFKARLQIDIRDRLSGQSILNATSGSFVCGLGIKNGNPQEFQPIIYNYTSQEFSSKYLPCGNYQIFYQLVEESIKGDVPIANEESQLIISPLSGIVLNYPLNESVLEETFPRFTWLPPTPVQLFSMPFYNLIIVQVNEGQIAADALLNNIPVYSAFHLTTTTEKLPIGAYSKLEPGNKYAWQITLENNNNCEIKSAVWSFKIKEHSRIENIISETPYVKMARTSANRGIAPNGVLKLSYINETNEKSIRIVLNNLSISKPTKFYEIKLEPGENLIRLDLKRLFKIKEGEFYEALIENKRNEKWVSQFEIRYSKEKNNSAD